MLSAATALLVLAGCSAQEPSPSSPSSPPSAEIAEGPDCLAEEVLAALIGGTPVSGSAAPRAGAVPSEFAPVRVVECRLPALTVREDEGPVHIPDVPGPGSDPALPEGADGEPEAGPSTVTVEEVTLAGDLEPLLAALSRSSEPVPEDLICPAMAEMKPQLYLVDARGRAVRPQWPVDACGFLHSGAAETLRALTEVDRATRTAQVELR